MCNGRVKIQVLEGLKRLKSTVHSKISNKYYDSHCTMFFLTI